LLSRYNFYNYY